MIIRLTEQIGIGNFGFHANGTQETAANNFARLLREKLTDFCTQNYPGAELEFDLSVENVSGCCSPFKCICDTVYSYPESWGYAGKYLTADEYNDIGNWPCVRDWFNNETAGDNPEFIGTYNDYVKSLQNDCNDITTDIEREIELEYESICSEIEQSGEIYE